MQKKKLMALGLAASLVVGMAGCGEKKTDADAAGSSSAVSTESKTDQAKTTEENKSDDPYAEKLDIVIGTMTSSAISDWKDNLLTKAVEERFNVDLEFFMLPANNGDWATKVTLMATAEADNMPDMLMGDGVIQPSQQIELGAAGAIQPIEDYVYDAEKMPYFNALSDKVKTEMFSVMLQSDGHIYGLGDDTINPRNQNPEKMWINTTWLDAVGKEKPTTTEELKDVLLAFRDNDPNGNGVQDEIGAYGRRQGWGEDIIPCLMASFVSWNNGKDNGGLTVDQNDGVTVVAPFVTEEWKEGLHYLNDLYEEGVLNAGIFTDDDTTYKGTINLDPPIVGLVDIASNSWITEQNVREQYDFLLPVEGPNGLSYYPTRCAGFCAEVVFTCTGEKLDRCIAIEDAMYDYSTPESLGYLRNSYGVYGVDWTDDPEVCAKANSLYLEAGLIDEIDIVRLNAPSNPHNWSWAGFGAGAPRNGAVWETTATMYNGEVYDIEKAGDEWQLDFLASLDDEKYLPKTLPVLNWTTEEKDAIGDTRSNITSYVNSFLAECVTGVQDIDKNWDGYLKEIESLGLQNWLDIAQTIYNRQRSE